LRDCYSGTKGQGKTRNRKEEGTTCPCKGGQNVQVLGPSVLRKKRLPSRRFSQNRTKGKRLGKKPKGGGEKRWVTSKEEETAVSPQVRKKRESSEKRQTSRGARTQKEKGGVGAIGKKKTIERAGRKIKSTLTPSSGGGKKQPNHKKKRPVYKKAIRGTKGTIGRKGKGLGPSWAKKGSPANRGCRKFLRAIGGVRRAMCARSRNVKFGNWKFGIVFTDDAYQRGPEN